MPEYDPKTRVTIEKIEKRGEWYTVRGRTDGRETTAHIPAPTLEAKSRKDGEALVRRTLLGTHLHRHEPSA